MIGAQGYPIYGQQMQPAYPQTYRPVYQPPQPMQMSQPQMDPGAINARDVMCREEAVAAQIIDGTPWLFRDKTHGMVYYKGFNSQTGMAEFIDFAMVRPQQPQAEQFAPMDALRALNARVEQIEQLLTAPKPKEGNADA